VKLFVDPWDPGYGPTAEGEDGPPADGAPATDLDVELPAAAWAARAPGPEVRAPDVVLFVDGVLRNDARGWVVDDEGTAHPTLAASYAAGAVRCDLRRGAAEVAGCEVRRALLTPAPGASSVGREPARYVVQRVEGSEQKHLDLGLRDLLIALEARVSAEVRTTARAAAASTVDGDDLLVLDGRLRGRRGLPRTIGYVKTHSRGYLPPELTGVVTALPSGCRSPVFRMGSLYSWYLRLPGPAGSPWAGVVRVECAGDLTSQEAIALADLATATLPRFAGTSYKDPRAPQNLTPIAGLERRLRGLLGDPRLLHRNLTRAAAAT
jgi:uncharacterized protein